MAETPIDPKEESIITWQGKELQTVVLGDPIPYVSVSSFCKAFGIDAANQRRRLNRNSWFIDYVRLVNVTTAGGPQASLCLRVDALPTFMIGIGVEGISDPEDQALFRTFMDESSAVLAEHWGLGEMGELRFLREQIARMAAESDSDPEERLPANERLDRVEAMIAEMRADIESRLGTMRSIFTELREDYRAVSKMVSPKGKVARIGDEGNEGLLADVKSRVDLLARLKTIHFREDRPYPSIWNYVNMSIAGVTTYRMIPVEKYQEVVDWLDGEIMAIEKAFPTDSPEH
ncbi:phage antirepressor N-terminal domain-containing protein [bacterium]|nr:phage antirepressor N-terminal domain-containing protein [bacterium]